MERLIKIGDRQIPFKATASTTRRYRAKFGSDIFKDVKRMAPLAETGEYDAEGLEIFLQVAYIMAKQADESIPDDPDEWLDQFDMFSIYEIMPQLLELWGYNNLTIENPKKKAGDQSGN